MSKRKIVLLTLLLISIMAIYVHNVSKKVTQEDKEYLSIIFKQEAINADTLNFEQQIQWIHKAVFNLHQDFALLQPIAYNKAREPLNLYANGGGFCYDFSRTLEKHFMNNGFQTRHVAVYLRKDNFWNTILSPGVFSHSLTEVKTKNGWLIIDSNLPFYAMDINATIYSFEDLMLNSSEIQWELPLNAELKPFYSSEIVKIYGLYSRHGKFYKPYNFLPDYNFRELFYNF
jgi:hypothetical protein